jgi:replicative DNA helicase
MHDLYPLEDKLPGILPHNMEVEQTILASILSRGYLFQYAAGWLDCLHFYQNAHQSIFQAMVELFAAQVPLDVVSVSTQLRETGMLEQAGGSAYIMDLALSGAGMDIEVGGEFTLRYHGKKIIDLAKRRETVKAAEEIAEQACDLSQRGYAETAQALLVNLTDAYQVEERIDTQQSIDSALDILQAELNAPNGVTGLSTGLPSLDRKTHGFQSHQLITLAARPGGGKSAMAMNIASHIAMEVRKSVLYISLEMTSAELIKRLVKALAGTDSDFNRLKQAAESLKPHRHRFLLEDSAGQTLATIQAKILKAKQAHPDLGLIVIDHIGLIAPDPNARKNQPKTYEVQEITSRFKVLAKSVQVPILQLAQMNRAVEARQDKKPMLSDLRDSGSIEQDSDLVLFSNIERDENRRPTGNASLTIAKQRDGVQAEIPLVFIPHLTKFKEKSI